MPRLFLFALVLALLSGCVVPVGGAAPAPASTFTPTPFSTDTPQPSKTPSPTVTETPTVAQTETATATETPILNPAEMQTESGIHGVKLDAIGSYEGVTQNVSVGITPDVNEFLGGNGVEFNDKASPVPVGDRLAEASLRAWYAAYLQRNNLSENAYSFETYLTDYKSGKDMKVSEWVYNPVAKTNSVEMLGPDTHVMYVVSSGLKWYGVPQYLGHFSISIQKYEDGIIVVETNSNFNSTITKLKMKTHLSSAIVGSFLWLTQPLDQQTGEVDLQTRELPQTRKIYELVWPDYLTMTDLPGVLLIPTSP